MSFNVHEFMRNRPQVQQVVATAADGTEYTVSVPQSMFAEVSK